MTNNLLSRRALLAGTASALVAIPRKGSAQILGIGNATEWTQLLNYATLLRQLFQQIQMARTVFSQYRQMMLDGQNLMSHPFSPIQSNLMQLFSVMNSALGASQS